MTSIFFSPRGTTKQTARAILGQAGPVEERDLLSRPLREDWLLPAGEPVLAALPVYAGRIPGVCRDMLRGRLRGSGSPAVAVVVYGNRDYDDALLELRDLLEEQGFRVVAAGAFVARHSIFTRVAADRPDGADRALMARFGARCREAVAAFDPAAPHTPPAVPGSRNYRKAGRVPFHPECSDRCMKCGACARSCPAAAIPPEEPWRTERDKCISCGACIHLCPTEARQYRGAVFEAAARGFEALNARRREPEVFF